MRAFSHRTADNRCAYVCYRTELEAKQTHQYRNHKVLSRDTLFDQMCVTTSTHVGMSVRASLQPRALYY